MHILDLLSARPGAMQRHMSVQSGDSPAPARCPPQPPGQSPRRGVAGIHLLLLICTLQSYHSLC